MLGGYWSAYWYRGRVYGTEIARGLDVFALTPSPQMTENEIAAASLANQGGVFNPQQQFPVTWPDHPVVALAYLDQLQRSGAVAPDEVAGLRQALEAAKADVNGRRRNPALASQIDAQSASVRQGAAADAITAQREAALRKTLRGVVALLR